MKPIKKTQLAFRILGALKLHTWTLAELAKALDVRYDAVLGAVHRLAAAGLVEKRMDLPYEEGSKGGRAPGLYGLTE